MTEAPERIWATGNAHYGSWNSVKVRNADHQVQYIRADHVDALMKAEREAGKLEGLQEAAEICDNAPAKSKQIGPNEEVESAHWCAAMILALIEKDATDG